MSNETKADAAETQFVGTGESPRTPVQGDPLDFKPVGIRAVTAAARYKPKKGGEQTVL